MEHKRRVRKDISKLAPPKMTPRGSSHPSQIFNLPPKKIIKSNINYFAKKVGELSFNKDDYFYVIAERPEIQCYEVINPILKTRGLVHSWCFDAFDKNGAEQQSRIDSKLDYEYEPSEHSEFDSLLRYNASHNLGVVKNQPQRNSVQQHSLYRDIRYSVLAIDPKLSLSKTRNSELNQTFKDMDFGKKYNGHNAHISEISKRKSFPPKNLFRDEAYQDKYDSNSDEEYQEYLDDFFKEPTPKRNSKETIPKRNSNRADSYKELGTSNLIQSSMKEILNLEREFEDVIKKPTREKIQDPNYTKEGLFIDQITVIYIDELNQDDYQLSIHLKYTNGEIDIMKRSLLELWDMHLDLLETYLVESGMEDTPRIIPFLKEPLKDMTASELKDCQTDANRYFYAFVYLPCEILYSDLTLKFFQARQGDVENAQFEQEIDSYYDLEKDLVQNGSLKIDLILGDEVIKWDEGIDISFQDLFYAVEDSLGFSFDNLLYMDETRQLIKLFGDDDLRLLKHMRTLTLYVA